VTMLRWVSVCTGSSNHHPPPPPLDVRNRLNLRSTKHGCSCGTLAGSSTRVTSCASRLQAAITRASLSTQTTTSRSSRTALPLLRRWVPVFHNNALLFHIVCGVRDLSPLLCSVFPTVTDMLMQNTFYWGPGYPSSITLPTVTMAQVLA
jgi:hypothetical protein